MYFTFLKLRIIYFLKIWFGLVLLWFWWQCIYNLCISCNENRCYTQMLYVERTERHGKIKETKCIGFLRKKIVFLFNCSWLKSNWERTLFSSFENMTVGRIASKKNFPWGSITYDHFRYFKVFANLAYNFLVYPL